MSQIKYLITHDLIEHAVVDSQPEIERFREFAADLKISNLIF